MKIAVCVLPITFPLGAFVLLSSTVAGLIFLQSSLTGRVFILLDNSYKADTLLKEVEDSFLEFESCLHAWDSNVVPIRAEDLHLELLDWLQEPQGHSNRSKGFYNPLANLLESLQISLLRDAQLWAIVSLYHQSFRFFFVSFNKDNLNLNQNTLL